MILLSALLLYLANSVCTQAAACNHTDIRLVGGRNELEGRVEVCFQGEWGTVCDDSWDFTDAIVVCRQLGLTPDYSIAFSARRNIFSPGTGPIFLDDVACTGNETILANCSHGGVGIHNCVHSEDAGVICPQVPACNNSDVRLVDGRNEYEGRVEICQMGRWGTVCDDRWDDTDALVVCRQLGIFTGDAIATTQTNFGPGIGPIFFDEVDCRGNEATLDVCPHRGIGIHDCVHFEDAGVVCSQQECTAGEVRLVDGLSEGNGRVEVCYRGVWGTVCDDSWDNDDAAVVCRQLGYSAEGAAATNFPQFGPGAGFAFLGNVRCTGNEANLTQCQHNGLGVHNCLSSQDAGVFCNTAQVERCSVDVESEQLNASQTIMSIDQIGTCEPYQQVSELCNAYFDENDNVYIPNALGRTQSEIANILSSIGTAIASGTAECQNNTLRIICHHVYVHCGRNGTLYPPTSICREECSYVRDTCLTVWSQALLIIARQRVPIIDCETPGSALAPLPSCCTGAGVIILPTTPEATSSIPEFPIIIGAALGGALLLVIVLLVLVITVAVMVMQKKKAAVHSIQLDVLTSPPSQTGINTYTESGVSSNTLSLSREEASVFPKQYNKLAHGSLLSNVSSGSSHQISPSYIRKLSGKMLISHENITLLECIGQGEFGIVYKAHLSGTGIQPAIKTVAVKTLKGFFDQSEISKIKEESLKMKHFNHPNVMSLIGVCTDAGPAPYIIMPFMANGSLLSYLRKERPNLLLKETTDDNLVLEVKKRLTVICFQIASGMEYLTTERFIHRDLATRNCMIDTHFVIKITDFGLSEDVYVRNYFRQGQGPAVKLPVKWMAPESLQDGVFSDKTDVWSFGITCWEIFSGGKTPYPGVDPLLLAQLLENGHRLNKPVNSACPDEMYSIMLKCWNNDPDERPPFSDLVSSISGFAEMTAGYLDMSNYDPFANEESNSDHVPSSPTEGEDSEMHSKGGLGSYNDILSDDPPVIIDVQPPSQPGSLL